MLPPHFVQVELSILFRCMPLVGLPDLMVETQSLNPSTTNAPEASHLVHTESCTKCDHLGITEIRLWWQVAMVEATPMNPPASITHPFNITKHPVLVGPTLPARKGKGSG